MDTKLKVLTAQKKDKTEFKIQEYQKDTDDKWVKAKTPEYKLLESFIIKDIEDDNKNYRTLNKTKLTPVKIITRINESTKKEEKNLTSLKNDTKEDNINSLPKY